MEVVQANFVQEAVRCTKKKRVIQGERDFFFFLCGIVVTCQKLRWQTNRHRANPYPPSHTSFCPIQHATANVSFPVYFTRTSDCDIQGQCVGREAIVVRGVTLEVPNRMASSAC